MTDRWKSLADRLGAPSFEPTVRPQRDPATQDTTNQGKPAPTFSAAEPESFSNISNDSSSPGSATSDEADVKPKREPRRSYFGPAPETPVEESTAERQPTIAENKTPEPSPKSDRPAKQKKKSFWGNLFGGSSEPDSPADEPEVRARPEPPAAETKTSGAKSVEPFGFDTLSSSEATNPALVEMFGAPKSSQPSFWDKPKRMVDDVSWEDDSDSFDLKKSDVPSRPHSSLGSTLDHASDDDSDGLKGSATDEDNPGRRRSRRRRRRGGRRDATGSESSGVRSGSSVKSEPFFDDADLDAEWAVDDEGATQPRSDTSRSRSETGQRRHDAIDDRGDNEQADRRSTRRRRGGRNRDRSEGDVVPESSREPRSFDDSASQSRSTKGSDNRNRFESDYADDDVEFVSRKESGGPESPSDESREESRGRRRKRSRGGKKSSFGDSTSSDSPSRSQAGSRSAGARPVDETDDSHADGDELDSELQNSGKHTRNIPTWEDALASVIAANLENHRRNDNRNPRGGGRPRGRR